MGRQGVGRAAFSLIELLCVVAIILILYVMYFSAGSKHYQRRQQEACAQNLQFVHQALRSHALDHQDRFPVVTNATISEAPLSLLVPAATTRTAIFICPGSSDSSLPEAKPFADRRISYAYVMGLGTDAGADQWLVSDAQVDTKSKAVGVPLFSSESGARPGNNHKNFGGVVLFADGRAERSPPRAAFALSVPTNAVVLNPRR